jgi:hypothetical protein
MCDPISITAFTTLASVGTSAANASAQSRYQDAQFDAAKKIADQSALASYASLQQRQQQEVAKASQSIGDSAVQANAARATARVNAAEGGAQGESAGALQDEFSRTELGYQHAVIRNQAFLDAQFGNEMQAVQAQQAGRYQQFQPQPVPMPNYASMLGAGYANYLQIQRDQNQTNPQH